MRSSGNRVTRTPHVRPARLKTRHLDGIEFMDDHVAVGKIYYVDVGHREMLHWTNAEHGGRQRDLECVRDVMDGGWLPLEILEVL